MPNEKPRKPPRSGRSAVPIRKFADLSDLIPHRIVADKLGVTPDTLRGWVDLGSFPLPHAVIERTCLYSVELIRQFLENGTWPEGTKFGGGR